MLILIILFIIYNLFLFDINYLFGHSLNGYKSYSLSAVDPQV